MDYPSMDYPTSHFWQFTGLDTNDGVVDSVRLMPYSYMLVSYVNNTIEGYLVMTRAWSAAELQQRYPEFQWRSPVFPFGEMHNYLTTRGGHWIEQGVRPANWVVPDHNDDGPDWAPIPAFERLPQLGRLHAEVYPGDDEEFEIDEWNDTDDEEAAAMDDYSDGEVAEMSNEHYDTDDEKMEDTY